MNAHRWKCLLVFATALASGLWACNRTPNPQPCEAHKIPVEVVGELDVEPLAVTNPILMVALEDMGTQELFQEAERLLARQHGAFSTSSKECEVQEMSVQTAGDHDVEPFVVTDPIMVVAPEDMSTEELIQEFERLISTRHDSFKSVCANWFVYEREVTPFDADIRFNVAISKLNQIATIRGLLKTHCIPCIPAVCTSNPKLDFVLAWEPEPVVLDARDQTRTFIALQYVNSESEPPDASVPDAPQPQPPVVAILAPANGENVQQGVSTKLVGSATDENQGQLACRWTSSNAADQFPATGCNIFRTFASPGARTLTLSATDAQDQTSTASVVITVTANLPPAVSLTTTLPPSNYESGYRWTTPLALSASATDPEGNTPITYEWKATSLRPNSTTVYMSDVLIGSAANFTWTPSTSSLFGDFGTFGSACYSGQIVRITVRAYDSLGNPSAPVNLPDIRIYLCTLD